ncbi:tRNA threonylcarbamoyladenosine biosynthesis protein TsaB [Buchnera aphidicola (Cinara pseudotaxifoliae)]|uniref:tRNA threonylcarbamoyladenosine biosynthesis protein TsaB n=1 Tax=Buchnera aphidicola (Cinara pseudotaxifoliae) TaxID=655384 RepID=A0A451DH36_9GAMM|nr:tRNA (adenosine(37)-N6)-threonylcarbamoyltransferase complex dimerization subunit type 1 TsaB [Buchnera aphidicola]VFP85936.1 tRNA threonylcarbamoyladenosine biosynthesis protein TsaB [Buchnera aphidicola (Cinara pseudotaxifoliae)]
MTVIKTILALDTTLFSCSVSLLYKGIIYSLFKQCSKTHEKNILSMINKLLNHVNITFTDIDLIACTIGPGSFTGIRISIGVSRTISVVYRIPVIGFSTLQILSEQSWNINKINRVLLTIQISKNQILWAKYIKKKTGLWIGNHTEKFFQNIHKIKKITKNYSGKWSTVGLNMRMSNFKKSIKLFYTHITTPHSKYIIMCTITYLKYNLKYNTTQLHPRYLHTIH